MRQRWAFCPLLVVLFLISGVVSGETQDDFVDLPAEFFFGRWTPGHRVEAGYEDTIGPGSLVRGRYEYCGDRVRVGADGLGNRLFFDHETYPHAHKFASFFGYFRPSPKLQIGVDQITYSREERSRTWPASYGPGGRLMEDEEWQFDLQASANYSRNETVRIPDKLARYAYLNRRAVGNGELLLDFDWGLFSFGEDQATSETSSSSTRCFRHSNSTPTANLTWGARDNLNLSMSLAFRTSSTSYDQYSTFFDTRDLRNTSSSSRAPIYSVQALFDPGGNLFLTFVSGQEFGKSKSERRNEKLDGGVSQGLDVNYYEGEWTANRIGLGVEYLTAGEFVPSVILDDYNNAYRHQLFGGQTSAKMSGLYELRNTHSQSTTKSLILSTGIARGISNRWQLGADLDYAWYRREELNYYAPWLDRFYNQATLSPRVSLKWRSFEYHAGQGSGWNRDESLDRIYGYMLRPGQATAAIYLDLPTYRADKFAAGGPFDASTFVSNKRGAVQLALDCGVVENFQVSVVSDWQLYSDWQLSGVWFPPPDDGLEAAIFVGLKGRARLWNKLEATLSLFDLQVSKLPGEDKADAVVRFDIRALL